MRVVQKTTGPKGRAAYNVEGQRNCRSEFIASRIDSNIDYSVSPCDDLYQFACGRWVEKNAIPEELMTYSTFGILREGVEIVLRNLLQEDHMPEDLECMKKAKDMYASCIDMDKIEERGDQILKDMLVRELGGWPLTHAAWDEDAFDLVDTLIKLNRLGENPIISFYVGLDSKDTSTRVLTMDQPIFGMPGQKYYQVSRDDAMLKAYEDLIYRVSKLIGQANPDTAVKEVKEIIEFEILLANVRTLSGKTSAKAAA
ncbi:membrane metallo-endopeptidase-like 1 [Elysia marginata]|uniref:Membrane metallo-endopeptidase-like 1 n=1 Tax=Elysia marginata TaxID=1093978 RepID=A0AAV4HWW7_9GAST|nr:membrane metallo-endopeptidase-like 1 [Elysia marginata]